MPILIPPMTALLNGYMIAGSIFGISRPQMASAISTGFVQYAIAGITVNTVDVGAVGVGAGVGTGLSLPQPVAVEAIQAAFSSAGVGGPSSTPLAIAVASAVSDIIRVAIASTVHVGVGAGTGKISLSGNPALSVPLMAASFFNFGLIGISSPQLSTALALGIDDAIQLTTGVTIIAGAPGPFPSSGVGVGKLL